ncbi:MAG TPA: DUF3817 domain-containing protein [Marisediminicola sp.]|jgi:integral membrane protein|nr:DUF3817 domain-containing protein [Marisediminicola sp.]
MNSSPAPLEVTRRTRHIPFSPRALYRTMAVAEAVTWTLLIAGMVLKYALQAGGLGVQVGGFLHGLVFLAYAMAAVFVGVNQRWSARLMGAAVVSAVVPYATIPFGRWLERRQRLDGPWRTTGTDDPRDRGVLDTLLRWVLNRPVLLVVLFVVGLTIVMATLLVIGPPGGR